MLDQWLTAIRAIWPDCSEVVFATGAHLLTSEQVLPSGWNREMK
jgi:hypothetical protein